MSVKVRLIFLISGFFLFLVNNSFSREYYGSQYVIDDYKSYYKDYIPPQRCNTESLKCYESCLKLKIQKKIYNCQIECNLKYLNCMKRKKEREERNY